MVSEVDDGVGWQGSGVKGGQDLQQPFIYFFNVLTVPCDMWDSSSQTRDRTHAPCTGRVESYPLGCKGSPCSNFFRKLLLSQIHLLGLCCVHQKVQIKYIFMKS